MDLEIPTTPFTVTATTQGLDISQQPQGSHGSSVPTAPTATQDSLQAEMSKLDLSNSTKPSDTRALGPHSPLYPLWGTNSPPVRDHRGTLAQFDAMFNGSAESAGGATCHTDGCGNPFQIGADKGHNEWTEVSRHTSVKSGGTSVYSGDRVAPDVRKMNVEFKEILPKAYTPKGPKHKNRANPRRSSQSSQSSSIKPKPKSQSKSQSKDKPKDKSKDKYKDGDKDE